MRFLFSLFLILTTASVLKAQETPKEATPPQEAPAPKPRVEEPAVAPPEEDDSPKAKSTPEPKEAVIPQPVPRPRPPKVRSEEVERLKRDIDASERTLMQIRQRSYQKQEATQVYQQQIGLRQELVSKYKDQIWNYASQKDSLEQSLTQIETDLTSVRRSARQHAIHLYKHGQMHDLILLLSARSINEFLVRVYYLRFFSNQRKQKLGTLKTIQMTLEARQKAINGIIQNNENLLQEAKSQEQRIEALKKEQDKEISALGDKEYRIEGELYRKRRYLEGLQDQIENLSSDDLVHESSASPPLTSAFSGLALREILSTHPTSSSAISSFGEGIEVAIPAQMSIKAGSSGTVSKVFIVSNLGNCVAITLQDYTVVYGNLSAIAVRKGQFVQKGDFIGESGGKTEPLGEKLFMAVLKQGNYLNPLAWLK